MYRLHMKDAFRFKVVIYDIYEEQLIPFCNDNSLSI